MKSLNKDISIIIVNYKSEEVLLTCLLSLTQSKTNKSFEVIVIDNSSRTDFERELKKKFPQVLYKKNKQNIGFGAANNRGAKISHGKYLFFLNPDTEISEKTLEILVTYLEKNESVAIAAPLLYHADGTIFEKQGTQLLTPLAALGSTSLFHRFFPHNPIAQKYWNEKWNKKTVHAVDVVPGTAFMIRKELFLGVAGFDEDFFLYFEEFDLCKRIKELGYKVAMVPQTKVIHHWGVSTALRDDREQIFQQSQEYYFKKHYGFLYGMVISYLLTFDKYSLLFLLVLIFAIFLRVYKISTLFMFIGDFGWFYLSAHKLITQGVIPLVSIPSSVVWLHQGPLATYLIALALWLGRMNPVSPALFFSLFDIGTIFFVYMLGKKLGNKVIGISAAFLYATSPLVLVNVRMPYHTSPIPFFACLVFLLSLTIIERKRYFFWLFLSVGLLLQLELSNSIVLIILGILYFVYRKTLSLTKFHFLQIIAGFVCGILPFILYDVTHRFIQTVGLPLWVLNRVRLFLGFTTAGNATTKNLPSAIWTVWDHIVRILFPQSEIVTAVVVCIILFIFFRKLIRKRIKILASHPYSMLCLWFGIPCLSYLIHAAPGDAYFPFIFPPLTILAAYSIYKLCMNKNLLTFVIIFLLGISNATYTLSSHYFLSTSSGDQLMTLHGNNFGPAFFLQRDAADAIVSNARGLPIQFRMGGYHATVATGGDHFKYLLIQKGVKLTNFANVVYTIYEMKEDVPRNKHLIFQNGYYFVTKEFLSSNEKKIIQKNE